MFGERLKKIRKENKITQEKLASIIEVECSSISKYESANVIPSAEVLRKIADYFNVSIDYLLGRTDEREFYKPLNKLMDELDVAAPRRIYVKAKNGDQAEKIIELSEEEYEKIGQILDLLRKSE